MAKPHLIAVVDDDRSVRRALDRLLRSAGFTVESFGSGPDLLASGAAVTASCFVLDIHLEGPNGFEVCERLREAGIQTTAIFMTAHDSEEVRERAASCPRSFFLRKPFDATTLIDLICVAVNEPARSPEPRTRRTSIDL